MLYYNTIQVNHLIIYEFYPNYIVFKCNLLYICNLNITIMKNTLSRQITINIITSDYDPIIEWFNELWCKLHIETEVGEIFYKSIDNLNGWVFYQDIINDRFWCNDVHYWSLLASKFNMKYNEIQIITKILVEATLNNNIPTPEKAFCKTRQ